VVKGKKMEFILSCIIIAIKSTIGAFFIAVIIWLIVLMILLISYIMNRNKKPKYKGKPIIINGGKKNGS
jgi:hypothetical protein